NRRRRRRRWGFRFVPEQIAFPVHRLRPIPAERVKMDVGRRRPGRLLARRPDRRHASRGGSAPLVRRRGRSGRRLRPRAIDDERERNGEKAKENLTAALSCHWPPVGTTSTTG